MAVIALLSVVLVSRFALLLWHVPHIKCPGLQAIILCQNKINGLAIALNVNMTTAFYYPCLEWKGNEVTVWEKGMVEVLDGFKHSSGAALVASQLQGLVLDIYKALHGTGPSNLRDNPHPVVSALLVHLSRVDALQVPSSRKHVFSVAASALWNSILPPRYI